MKVTIIVKDGMVREVYGTDKNISVEVIDLDTHDEEDLEEFEMEANRVRSEQHCIW